MDPKRTSQLRINDLSERQHLPSWRTAATEAIRLTLEGAAAGGKDDANVEVFLKFLSAQHLKIDWIAEALQGDQRVAACIGIASPGHIAMVLLSSIAGHPHAPNAMVHMLRYVEQQASNRQTLFLQALVAPDATGQINCLEQAGFKFLAVLRYMALQVSRASQVDRRGVSTLSLLEYETIDPAEFSATLEKTYIDTLDCPELRSLRTVHEAINSHRGTGLHDPTLWFMAREHSKPLGVLLLTGVPLRDALEIVYVGLVPDARGRGYGKELVRHAIEEAKKRGQRHLILAVDERNHYALEIYSALGFSETDRRVAWIKVLES